MLEASRRRERRGKVRGKREKEGTAEETPDVRDEGLDGKHSVVEVLK